MEVILLDKVNNLGNLGDKVRVRRGYARNFLLPRGKAVRATAENLAEFEKRRAELERRAAEELAAARARAEQMGEVELRITARSGEQGKLFGSIGPADIVDAARERGIEIERAEIRMPHGPIRALGEHEIGVHLHSDVDVNVRLHVVGQGGETGPSLTGTDAKEADREAADARDTGDE